MPVFDCLDPWSSVELELPVSVQTPSRWKKQTRVQRVLIALISILAFCCLYFYRDVYRSLSISHESGCYQALPDLYEAGIFELQTGLDAGHFTSVDLVNVCNCPFFTT